MRRRNFIQGIVDSATAGKHTTTLPMEEPLPQPMAERKRA
jgi:hypothetical protein